MTSHEQDKLEKIYSAALQMDPAQRSEFVREACEDESLRAEIESLLAHDQAAGSFLEEPASEAITNTTIDESPTGQILGRYHLLQKIGEGGMGEVWLAEQKEPVRRRVALKLVKAGMNSREVMARFESERQALALMDHPAIAKVLDAGSTPKGAPPLELRKLPFDEFLRKLREEEPPKPSTKIRTHDAATSTEVARKRQSEPRALAKQMRGDLDSIA